jgi:predicted dehydrogenase
VDDAGRTSRSGRRALSASRGAQLRVAFVGAGAVAARHANTLRGFPDVRVVAVADPDGARATTLAAGWDATVHADVRQMLQASEPDAVYICVPPFAHGEPEAAALDAGVPFFVEKPLACDVATAVHIAHAVERQGLVTAVGYHWRYLDTVERAAELLRERLPRLVLGFWLDKVPPPVWWLSRASSGGQIVEQATHVLDLARLLVGEVEEVSALASHTPRTAYPDADVDDVSAAILRFTSGAVGNLAATCLLQWKHQAALQVFADGLALEVSEVHLTVDTGDGPLHFEPQVDAKRLADRAFLDAVRGATERVRTPYAEALRTHRLACAIASAAEHRRPFALGDNNA